MAEATPAIPELVSRLRTLAERAYPAPWCWEQCGLMEDAPVLGVAWREDDPTNTPIAGKLRDFSADGQVIEYYREALAFQWPNLADGPASANIELVVELRNNLDILLDGLTQFIMLAGKAAAQFRFYEQQHLAKNTPDADAKAEVNAALATEFEAALGSVTEVSSL